MIDEAYEHTATRAQERYGFSLSKGMWEDMALRIQRHDARFIGRQSNMRTIWTVYVDEADLHVIAVYSKRQHKVVTVLAPGWRPENKCKYEGKKKLKIRSWRRGEELS
jgi:hypothetical protein